MNYPTRSPISCAVIEMHIELINKCIYNLSSSDGNLKESWRLISDVVNMSETFVTHRDGIWRGCDLKPVSLADDDGLIDAGIKALVEYCQRFRNDEQVPLSGDGAERIYELVECYEEILHLLPHSEVQKCRNITSSRISKIRSGAPSAHDIII